MKLKNQTILEAEKDENGFLFYNDKNKSEKYKVAYPYESQNGGKTIVQKLSGNFSYRDENGNCFMNFESATPFMCGFSLVKIHKENGVRFLSVNGTLSKQYFKACPFEFGYASVMTKEGETFYLDMAGREEKMKSVESGYLFAFFKGECDLKDIPTFVFADDKICNALSDIVENRWKVWINNPKATYQKISRIYYACKQDMIEIEQQHKKCTDFASSLNSEKDKITIKKNILQNDNTDIENQ